MRAHEKGRARSAQRPFDLFPNTIASCPTGVTEIIDGDTLYVSRIAPERNLAVSSDPQEHGDAQHFHRYKIA
jgi:hypothetical protein